MTDDLVTRAKAAMAEHEAYVAEQGGQVVSRGLMPELVDRIEQDAATIARLEGERDEARASADVYAGFNDAAEAKVAALVEAMTLAANRLQRCAVDYDTGSRKFIETGEWAEEARAAIAAAKGGE